MHEEENILSRPSLLSLFSHGKCRICIKKESFLTTWRFASKNARKSGLLACAASLHMNLSHWDVLLFMWGKCQQTEKQVWLFPHSVLTPYRSIKCLNRAKASMPSVQNAKLHLPPYLLTLPGHILLHCGNHPPATLSRWPNPDVSRHWTGVSPPLSWFQSAKQMKVPNHREGSLWMGQSAQACTDWERKMPFQCAVSQLYPCHYT